MLVRIDKLMGGRGFESKHIPPRVISKLFETTL